MYDPNERNPRHEIPQTKKQRAREAGCIDCGVLHDHGSPTCPAQRVDVVVNKRYHLEKILGIGGMATVYRALDLRRHESVALKILHPELVGKAIISRRFLHEANAAASVHHPGIIRVLGTGQTEWGAPFLVMELLLGEPLDLVMKRGQLPVNHAVMYALDVLNGLTAAHSAGMVHRDLKPANLFLARSSAGSLRVKVLDLGVAKLKFDQNAKDLTRTGDVLGTPRYMSPEQLEDLRNVDQRSDIYSVGAIMFAMLTGYASVEGRNSIEILSRLLRGDVERHPKGLQPEVPDWLDAVVAKALSASPEDRFQSAREMASVLSEGLRSRLGDIPIDDEFCPTVSGVVITPEMLRPGGEPVFSSPGSSREKTLESRRLAQDRSVAFKDLANLQVSWEMVKSGTAPYEIRDGNSSSTPPSSARTTGSSPKKNRTKTTTHRPVPAAAPLSAPPEKQHKAHGPSGRPGLQTGKSSKTSDSPLPKPTRRPLSMRSRIVLISGVLMVGIVLGYWMF